MSYKCMKKLSLKGCLKIKVTFQDGTTKELLRLS